MRLPRTDFRYLADFELFASLSRRALDRVASLCAEVSVAPGQVLTIEHRPGRQAFVIRSGLVLLSAGGSERQTLGDGELLGEMALLYGSLRSATSTTVDKTRLLVFNRQEFASLLEDHQIRDRVCATANSRQQANLIGRKQPRG